MKYVIKELIRINCVKFGHFTLKSGLKSNIYINLRNVMSYPEIFKQLLGLLYQKIISENNIDDYDVIMGIPNAGVPYACHLSFLLNKPMIQLRKEAKDYGISGYIDGNWKNGQRVLILEDVMTTGESLFDSIKKIEDIGLIVHNIYIITNRNTNQTDKLTENKYNFTSLFTINDFQREYSCNYITKNLPRSHVLNYKLKDISELKQTKVILSADLSSSNDIFNLLDKIGSKICALKIHCDIIQDWSSEVIDKLIRYKKNYNFLIIEDRKWCDIGNTIKLQLLNSYYNFSKWCDIMTVHTIGGQSIISAIYEYSKDIGLLLVAEMSTKDNLLNYEYTQKTIKIARNYPNIMGFICQHHIDDSKFIYCSPGININTTTDTLGQTYNTPENMLEKGIDYFIVGRGLYESKNPEKEVIKYII